MNISLGDLVFDIGMRARKIAAKMGPRYLEQLAVCEETVSRNVTHNLLVRHLRPLFLEQE